MRNIRKVQYKSRLKIFFMRASKKILYIAFNLWRTKAVEVGKDANSSKLLKLVSLLKNVKLLHLMFKTWHFHSLEIRMARHKMVHLAKLISSKIVCKYLDKWREITKLSLALRATLIVRSNQKVRVIQNLMSSRSLYQYKLFKKWHEFSSMKKALKEKKMMFTKQKNRRTLILVLSSWFRFVSNMKLLISKCSFVFSSVFNRSLHKSFVSYP
jgi:hypothetical protein